MADAAIQSSKMHIACEECRLEKFFGKFIQCEKCQGFGHTRIHCKREVKCGICVQEHLSTDHGCSICQVKDKSLFT